MDQIQSSHLRAVLTTILDQVFHHRKVFEITRNGKVVAALVHPNDLEVLRAAKKRSDLFKKE